MSKKEKRITELLKFPNTMRFFEVQTILEDKGYTLERTKGSHHIFKKDASIVNVPVHNKVVKVEYLKNIAKMLEVSVSEVAETKESKEEEK